MSVLQVYTMTYSQLIVFPVVDANTVVDVVDLISIVNETVAKLVVLKVHVRLVDIVSQVFTVPVLKEPDVGVMRIW